MKLDHRDEYYNIRNVDNRVRVVLSTHNPEEIIAFHHTGLEWLNRDSQWGHIEGTAQGHGNLDDARARAKELYCNWKKYLPRHIEHRLRELGAFRTNGHP